MAKKKPKTQPSTLTVWTDAARTAIAYGLQIASTSAHAAGTLAYDLFQRLYQTPETIASETTRAPIAAVPTPKATETPTTTAPTTPTPQTRTTKKPKRKKATPPATATRRDYATSNFSGTSDASSETASGTISPTPSPSETPKPRTAEDIKKLLEDKLPSVKGIKDNAQGKYHLRHLMQLKKCLNNLKDSDLAEGRYEYYEAQIATIGPSIEERIIKIGQIYNQLMAELAEPEFEQKLFCMLPYNLAGSKVSGQQVAEVLEKLERLRPIFAAEDINIDFFLCGTSILAPNLAQDIDITIHAKTTSGAALPEKLFKDTFLSLVTHLKDIGFHYFQLIIDQRHTHLLSIPNAHGEDIKVDVTYYNSSVEETLTKGLTNISAVYLGFNGDMHATTEIKEFYTDNGTAPKVVMCRTAELTSPSNVYDHIQKVHDKAARMGWARDCKLATWLHANSDKPTLASPPRSRETATSSILATSPAALAFHKALEAKRAATALAASATSSP